MSMEYRELSEYGPMSSKKVKNRPHPAIQRKQPKETLRIENIRKWQQKDDEISGILRLKENSDSVKPPISSSSHTSFEYKFWYSRWELLTIDRGLLCYRWMEKDCETLKVCVPRILCDSVMWYLHDAKTAGHMGIRRTISKLMNSQYYWPQ